MVVLHETVHRPVCSPLDALDEGVPAISTFEGRNCQGCQQTAEGEAPCGQLHGEPTCRQGCMLRVCVQNEGTHHIT